MRQLFKLKITSAGFTPIQSGFTLLELLIVIVIIGILSSFISVSLFGGLTRSRDAQRKSDLKQLQTALQLYFQDNNEYPPSCISNDPCWTNLLGNQPNPYIKSMPKDPVNDTNPYHYCFLDTNKYVIVANLENSEDPDIKEDNTDCSTSGPNWYWITNPS